MKVELRILSVVAIAVLVLLGALPATGAQAEEAAGGWDGGMALQMNLNNGIDQFVAQSESGNKMAVWVEIDTDDDHFLCFSMYTAGNGWSWPAIMASYYGDYQMRSPQVAMADDGSAIVCWIVYYDDDFHIYSRDYVPGTGWGEPFYHGITNSWGWREYVLSMNGDGDALLAHESEGTTERSVQVWTYESGVGWNETPEEMLTVPVAEDLNGIYATMSDSGRAAVIWQHIGSENSVMVSTRDDAGSWEAPSVIDDPGMYTSVLRAGIDDSTGEFMVTYPKAVPSYTPIYFSVTEDGVWSVPAPVAGVNDSICWNHKMVMNHEGVAVVVTTEYIGTGWDVNATMYDDGEWSPVISLGTNLSGLFYPEIAIDDLGRAVVTFTLEQDRVAAIYTPEDGWSETVPIERNAISSTYSGAWVSICSRSILVGYSCVNSVGTVWVSSYEFPDTEPPALLIDQDLTSETDRPLFEITGSTEPGATIDVNGKQVAVFASGEFSTMVELSPGANILVVTATDDAGNNATKTLTVTYNDPVPGLEDQIGDQQEAIDGLQDDLDAANDQIAGVESTAMLFGILGVVGLVVAIVALVMVFMRRKG